MKLFSFQIPEVAHLPESEREAILRRINQEPRMQMYRLWAPRICVGILLAGVPVLVFFLHAGGLALLCYPLISPFLVWALKIAGEVVLLRAEARKAVERGG
jgi:hypothetical protein